MEVLNKTCPSNFLDTSFIYSDQEDDEISPNFHEKSFVTVNVDSFNEKEFNNLLNCLDTIRESSKKRKNKKKIVKNYCVQVPYIDNSIRLNESDLENDEIEEKCNEMKNDISQMFSYFDEDVQFNFDEEAETKKLDSKPIIRGVVRKPNAPCESPNILNKNQVDKIMNEFNRVKINYYSKENCVEFTDIDYFYCDSDLESTRSCDKTGKLNRNVMNKFKSESDFKTENESIDARKLFIDTEIVPKNSVRDKIDMFSKLDTPLTGGQFLCKSYSAPTPATFRNSKKQQQIHGIIKNTSSANKNQNKCFIKDINKSISEKEMMLQKIMTEGKLQDSILIELERILNNFDMSLIYTINGLMNDNAFTLDGQKMKFLKIYTNPKLEIFNSTFDSNKIDNCKMESVDLSVIESNKIQLQLQVKFREKLTNKNLLKCMNVIFMAKYDDKATMIIDDATASKNSFDIFITSFFEPPENELQKARESNVTLSEHQLRVQASLQKLNIPDWYKQYSATGGNQNAAQAYVRNPDVSGILRKRNSDIGRWQGLSSKTTSLSSLGSNRSDRSPVMLSPSAHSHHGGQTGFSRWSTSHLNSSQTSPSVSARSSFVRNTAYASTMSGQSNVSSVSQTSDIRNSFRKPYLGWRSQEKLNQPRTAHERLASSLMSQKQTHQQQPIATPEIQSSIKEVTSAIVHYVNDQTNRGSRSRSVSPSTRCWLESSFVGTKPLESPQTPALENQFGAHKTVNIGPMSVTATNYETIRLNGIGGEDLANQSTYRGLSTFSTFKPSPSQPQQQQQQAQAQSKQQQLTVEQQSHSRRHSEGDCQKKLLEHHSQDYEDEKSDEIGPLMQQRTVSSTSTSPAPQYRRISLDSTEAKRGDLLRCRYPKCEVVATQADAKKNFKSCHNCSHLYCSRDCRRNHWERGHRRACLHSRVSALCRQVLSTCKDDADTLKHLSLLARRGFMSQGRGVVRLLFRSPENADLFIKQGFQCLGEVSFVRWPELMPQEMGPELYSELLKLSNEYKPESKMLIYVAICVVSEAPSSSTAPVKWERQLVSRCAKLKLCKSIMCDKSLFSSSNMAASGTDVLILTFNTADKFTQKSREIILTNVTAILQQKGINLRKHHPEVYQRLSNYVEGLTEKFLPVTIHPRDSATGKSFVCIIFPQNGDTEKIKMPGGEENSNDRVQTIDVGIERTELTQNSLNDDLFTEGTKF
ncbi:hypothetical protein PVAND_012389 [Polypedilum vanderplanki]|uniref:Apical junction molecule ajm1 alpha/beta domain-containing protein n=1 Tax=Polypedilum vanderplanki TaxID=319348 RepID=A0A9J6CN98_POLVA|nr:hypothetical protein PVAND_012389 [Polypedilum vanderplanki]